VLWAESYLSHEAVSSSRFKPNQTCVAQYLELLTYLGFDVMIVGIKAAQFFLKSVGVGERESIQTEFVKERKDGSSPSARGR
jgi:hypothetical protein